MEPEQTPTAQQQKLVMWVLWAGFLVGGCVQYYFLHQKTTPPAPESQAWLAALAPVALSIIVRWTVLPRVQAAQPQLTVMVLGVALAESAIFIGIFIFPAHQLELFIAAILGIFQFAPVYAGAVE